MLSIMHVKRTGVINLIPKKDQNSLFPKNLRLITLLNIDFKILAKVLANRMQNVIDYLIRDSQSGFMRGRNIAFNIQKTLDVRKITDIEKI